MTPSLRISWGACAALGITALALLAAPSPARGAPSPFDDCEAKLAADPQGWWTCGCFYGLASRPELREEAAARLEAHRSADPNNPCLAFALGRLVQEDRGGRDAAPLFEQAANGYRARHQADGEVYARINLSQALLELKADGARLTAEIDRAREVAEATENRVLVAQVAVNEARLLLRSGGSLDLVEASLLEARREVFDQAHPSLQRDILSSLGDVLYRQGQFAEAERIYGELTEIAAAAGLLRSEASARLNRAIAAAAGLPNPSRRQRVIRLLEEALATAREAHHPLYEIEAHKRLGRLIGGAEGRAHLDAALALAEGYRGRDPGLLARVLSASAMDLLQDDPAEARRRVDEAFALLAEVDDPWSQVSGWANRLRVLWATAPRDEALAASLSTLEIADHLGTLQETEEGQAKVDSVWSEIYHWLVGQLLLDAERTADPESLATAFSVAERMRARLLLESLAAAGVATTGSRSETAPEPKASLRRVELQIVDAHRRVLDPRLPTEERQRTLSKLDRLELEEGRLSLQLRKARGARVTQPDELVDLAELRANLAPDEALLAFQVGLWETLDGSFASGSWLLVATRSEVRVHRIPGRAELEPQVQVFLGFFDRRDGSEAKAATALYDALLRNALDALPETVERLVIVPDGPLHRLPFAALRGAPDASPLSVRYQLFVTPSATVWHRLRALDERGGDRGDDALGLALALVDPTTLAGVPAAEALPDAERSWISASRLAALPHARKEGRSALRSLGNPAQLLLGAEATERAVKERVGPDLRLVHFGTHAILDEDHPQRSAVLLAPGHPEEDGLLRPQEAAELHLHGAVVVLAACQSSSGTVLRSEGALSLARAFLQGGAGAVVGSLWPVADEEAADLLESFYRHLGRGEQVAQALAQAQREAVEAGAPAVAWAGWTVLGNGNAMVPEGRPRGGAVLRAVRGVGWGPVSLVALVLLGSIALLALRIGRLRRV